MKHVRNSPKPRYDSLSCGRGLAQSPLLSDRLTFAPPGSIGLLLETVTGFQGINPGGII